MKELDFYEEYMFYLDWRLNEGQITKGKHSLFKISKSEYDKFIKRLETDESFNEKFVKLLQSEKRDEKIESIINDDLFKDLEEFEYKETTTTDSKIDDIFNDFDL
jgi:uncharacterized membrane-anchored protein YjiN (DUF445 family)